MEQLKNIGQVCRQNYEKLVLILVLILLAGAVWMLFQESQNEKEKIRQIPIGFDRKTIKLVQPVKLDRFVEVMKVATNPPALAFSGPHNLFNPVKWERRGAEVIKVQKGDEVGPGAMRIVRISPIFLTIDFVRTATSGTAPDITVSGYHTVVTNELSNQPRLRRLPQFATLNATNLQVFVLTEVKGPPEAPTEFVAQLKDFGNETVSFAPGKPYTRAVGYEVELKYLPSGKIYPKLRNNSPVDIDGEPYKVVDIAPSKVVLSDDSNGKRYTIEQIATP